jgi:hypothetical protein
LGSAAIKYRRQILTRILVGKIGLRRFKYSNFLGNRIATRATARYNKSNRKIARFCEGMRSHSGCIKISGTRADIAKIPIVLVPANLRIRRKYNILSATTYGIVTKPSGTLGIQAQFVSAKQQKEEQNAKIKRHKDYEITFNWLKNSAKKRLIPF